MCLAECKPTSVLMAYPLRAPIPPHPFLLLCHVPALDVGGATPLSEALCIGAAGRMPVQRAGCMPYTGTLSEGAPGVDALAAPRACAPRTSTPEWPLPLLRGVHAMLQDARLGLARLLLLLLLLQFAVPSSLRCCGRRHIPSAAEPTTAIARTAGLSVAINTAQLGRAANHRCLYVEDILALCKL